MSCKGTGRRFLIPCPRRISFQGLNESAIYRTDNADRKSVVNHGSRAASSRYRGMLKVRRKLPPRRISVKSVERGEDSSRPGTGPVQGPTNRASWNLRQSQCNNPNIVTRVPQLFTILRFPFPPLDPPPVYTRPRVTIHTMAKSEGTFLVRPSSRFFASFRTDFFSARNTIFFAGMGRGEEKKKERHLGVYVRDMLYRTTRHAPRLDSVADSP